LLVDLSASLRRFFADFVPVGHRGFAEVPAKVDGPSIQFRPKIEMPVDGLVHHDAQLSQFADVVVEANLVGGQRIVDVRQFFRERAVIGQRRGVQIMQAADLSRLRVDARTQTDQVAGDLADQGQSPIGLIGGIKKILGRTCPTCLSTVVARVRVGWLVNGMDHDAFQSKKGGRPVNRKQVSAVTVHDD